MERELLLTGIGGQGIQLAAQLMATALAACGRGVQLFGSYGGMMRGGATEATLIAAEGADVQGPPTVSSAWSAIVMHDAYAEGVLARLRPDGLLVVNSSLCRSRPESGGPHVLEVATGDLVVGQGAPAATLVAVGAYCRATELVTLDALVAALPAVLPSYRRRHEPTGIKALTIGYHSVARCEAPAWEPAEATR
ncbi:2-oxoacid:acceptor oxidoreductase family protein [Streptacidiphilus rugosus]|uniref:2-oxoacid:acceptor oxidoreductase family protein n=1 Tax=Streptacidiphilus rugosus TaxID=405783 RepID=UPI00056801A4|nr:2-oxoacid:acceptor oxidoreductase family protein [Streptacidiphilus rugosus]